VKDEDFVEISAFIRILEKRILSTSVIDRIYETSDIQGTLRQVSQNSEYDFTNLKNAEDYETVLQEGLKNFYASMYKLSPHAAVVDIPAAKYDFHNLKVILKSYYAGTDGSNLWIRITDTDLKALAVFVETGIDVGNIPAHYKKTVKEVGETFEKTGVDPQMIDVICDKHMFSRTLALCEEVNSEFITEHIKSKDGTFNIRQKFACIFFR